MTYSAYPQGRPLPPLKDIKRGKHVVRKEVEPIFSGEEAFKNAAKTKGSLEAGEANFIEADNMGFLIEATCPQCNCDEAYFNQVQTRSADEPSTLFFKCTNADCGAMWSEN
ncbi:hypothetical protein QJS04_geneDACA010536 [Acorus gramineus]|uniref:TFIIS-type domain-containing protein n=1 Tax=Acorus gramineus TaxID=55184 RepID=A0AAV9AMW4_ACOGR|nr:hypothetical protein QJS04_geneDACA010536 [Acorus gramineus]